MADENSKTFRAKLVGVGSVFAGKEPEGKDYGICLLTKCGKAIKIPLSKEETKAFGPSFGNELEITIRSLP